MKKIEATIPALNAHDIIDQLRHLEIESLATSDVTVIDKNSSHEMVYRGSVYKQEFSHCVKVEVSVSDKDASRAESLLTHAA